MTGGFVYLMGGPDGLCKIGHTSDLWRRRRDLGPQVRLLWWAMCGDSLGVEQAFHRHFAVKRIRGEWFELEADDVQWLMRTELYFPAMDGFVSGSPCCRCHPPRFTSDKRWTGFALIPMRVD